MIKTVLFALALPIGSPATAHPSDPAHPAWLVGHFASGGEAHCYQGQSIARTADGLWTSSFSNGVGGRWWYRNGVLTTTFVYDGAEPDGRPVIYLFDKAQLKASAKHPARAVMTGTRPQPPYSARVRSTRGGYIELASTGNRQPKTHAIVNVRCGPARHDATSLREVRRRISERRDGM